MLKSLIFSIVFLLFFSLLQAQEYKIISKDYDDIGRDYYHNGTENQALKVMLNHKWGLINQEGQEILSPKYDKISTFVGDKAIATLDNINYVINTKGEELYKNTQYNGIELLGDELIKVKLDSKYGVIDLSGKTIITTKYKYITYVGKSYFFLYEQDKGALFDKEENQITAAEYNFDFGATLSEGLINLRIDKKWGVINTKGEVIIPFEYDYISAFNQGLASFNKEGKGGIMNQTGKVLMIGDYSRISNFSEGLAFAESNKDNCIFIDKTGKKAINRTFYNYEIPSYFINGSAIASIKGVKNLGLVNTKGDKITDFKYYWIDGQVNGYYTGLVEITKDKKEMDRVYDFDVINSQGKIIITLRARTLISVGRDAKPIFFYQSEKEDAKYHLIELK